MDTSLQTLVLQIGKCAILVTIGALVVGLIVRKGPAAGARWVRVACALVLLQGWMLFPKTVTLAWLKPAAAQSDQPDPGDLRPYVPETIAAPMPASLWSPWRVAAGLWLSGMVITAMAAWAGHRHMTQSLIGARFAAPTLRNEWQRVTGDLAGCVRVLVGATRSPVLCRLRGHWSLVLPQDFATTLDEHERRTVFRHEFAHFRRYDCVKSLLVALLVLPQWFNPAAWRLARWFREAAEWSCDDYAASDGDGRLCLAKVLHRLSAQSRASLPCGMMGVAEQPVVARVRRLLAPRIGISRTLLLALTAFLLACMAASATQVRLVPAEDHTDAVANTGITTGMLRGYNDGKLTLADTTGHVWEFTCAHACLQTYHPGETYTVHWRQGQQGLVPQTISGEGACVGTVVRVHDAGLEIRPHDGGPVQHIRAHWDPPTPAHPHGASNPDDIRVIQNTKVGEVVRVRWKAEEWKRIVELTRLPAP